MDSPDAISSIHMDCPGATFSTTHPTWTVQGSEPKIQLNNVRDIRVIFLRIVEIIDNTEWKGFRNF
jgi:hypothetical protein